MSTRQAYLQALRRSDNSLADDPKEKMEILKEKFFPQSPNAKLDDIENYFYPKAIETPAITDREIMTAISRSGLDKAPGSDGIPNRIWRHIGHLIIPDLNRIFNSSLHLNYYPKHFQNSITIVLRKPKGQDQKDYSLPKSYRPIALLNTIGKILESVIASRIGFLVEKYQLLPKLHIRGKKGRSTEEALNDIIEKVYAGWNKDQVASLLMLDISGVYNYVCQNGLLHNLRKRKIKPEIVGLIASFSSDRTTTMKTNEYILEDLKIQCGIPQGSPLSPILFLFYNADLLNICSSINPKLSASAFIDDTSLLAIGSSTEESCLNLAKAHKKCLEWAETHGAVFAPSKYQLLHLTRQKKFSLTSEIQLSPSQIIKPGTTGRLLEVILDSKLRWNNHIESVKTKAMISLGAIARLSGSTWGGNFTSLRQLYRGVVIPQISYACSLWYIPMGEKGHRKSYVQMLQSVQTKVARIITGAFKATSLPALDVEGYLLPLHLQLEKLAGDAVLRLATNPSFKTLFQVKPRRKTHKASPLEALIVRFGKQ